MPICIVSVKAGPSDGAFSEDVIERAPFNGQGYRPFIGMAAVTAQRLIAAARRQHRPWPLMKDFVSSV